MKELVSVQNELIVTLKERLSILENLVEVQEFQIKLQAEMIQKLKLLNKLERTFKESPNA